MTRARVELELGLGYSRTRDSCEASQEWSDVLG